MKTYLLFYFDDAKIDVKESKKWYKKQREGLEKRFAEAVKEVIYDIQNNPLAYELRGIKIFGLLTQKYFHLVFTFI